MLKPRISVERPLGFCLWISALALAGFWGCQGPDTFLRKDGTGGTTGAGGFRGTGGAIGVGGHVGIGGTIGTGTGGVLGGVGGRVGTGGMAPDGSTDTGGLPGTGGARDAGVDAAGVDGMIGTGGQDAIDANPDSEGGVVANGPCAGLCAPAISFSQPPNFASPQFTATTAACYETTSVVNGGGCSNCAGRTNMINGTAVSITGWPSPLPARVRGGYCIQLSAGAPDSGALDYASFYTF